MTKKEHILAIVAATLPLAIWLPLGLVNPRFASRMFVNSSAQPWDSVRLREFKSTLPSLKPTRC